MPIRTNSTKHNFDKQTNINETEYSNQKEHSPPCWRAYSAMQQLVGSVAGRSNQRLYHLVLLIFRQAVDRGGRVAGRSNQRLYHLVLLTFRQAVDRGYGILSSKPETIAFRTIDPTLSTQLQQVRAKTCRHGFCNNNAS